MTTLSKNARLAGLLYILASAVGIVRLLYIPSHLFVQGNATATASNIATHESLFRFGIVSNLTGAALWLFVPLALYRLLKGIDHGLAVVMVILGSLMQVPFFVINTGNDVAALLFARGADYLSIFEQSQRVAFVRLFLNLHHQLDLANFIFAGLWLLPFGLLVYRSRFLPRFLGVWLMLECPAWLLFSLTGFLLPGHESKVFEYMQPLAFAEVVTMFWLAILGAKEQRLVPSET
jgi:hypothetical protein